MLCMCMRRRRTVLRALHRYLCAFTHKDDKTAGYLHPPITFGYMHKTAYAKLCSLYIYIADTRKEQQYAAEQH